MAHMIQLACINFTTHNRGTQRRVQLSAAIACTDATAALPWELRSKAHQAKPSIPAEYRLESPVSDKDAMSPDQQNPIVFYDVW